VFLLLPTSRQPFLRGPQVYVGAVSGARDAFVGRGVALGALDAAASDAAAGSARFVLVDGPAGVGKTALIQRFADLRSTRGLVRVDGFESESVVPFGVATQLLCSLGDGEAIGHPADQDLREGAIEIGGRLLVALGAGGDQPLTIVVDDAHWVDEPSVHAIAFAFRRLDADPVLIVAACRPDTPISETWRRLASGSRGSRLTLTALAVADVRRLGMLFDRSLSAAAARRLRDHTNGMPLHITALLRELDADVLNSSQGPLPAPRSFATVVLHRAAALSPGGQAFVEAAAVLGDRARFADVAAVASIADPLGAFDEAVGAQLVAHHRGPSGDDVSFTHALVRAAVLNAVAPARLVALHLRCADELEDTAALEHRAAAALSPDAGLAAQLRSPAHAAIERGSIDLGVRMLLQAARLEPDRAECVRTRLAALEATVWGGALVAANALAAELRADLDAADDKARVLYLRGFLALLNGRRTECEELLLAAWEHRAPDTHPLLASQIATRLAQLFNIFGMAARTHDAVTWAERSFELEPMDASAPRAPSAIFLVSLVLAGRVEEAVRRALHEDDTDAALAAGRFDDVLGRGITKLWTDDLDGARADLSMASRPAGVRRPYLPTRLWALGFLADADYRAGAWDDSVANAELATSLAEDAEHSWLLGVLHGVAALPRAARGDWEAAAVHVETAQSVAAFVDSATSRAYAASAAAALATARQDHAGVLAATDPLVALDPDRGAREPGVFDWCALRIEALAALGSFDEAEQFAQETEQLVIARGRRSAIVALSRAQGVLEAARDSDDAATRAFTRGIAAAEGLRMPFLAARLDVAFGSFLRRKGRRRIAGSRLQAALEVFTTLGARPYVEWAMAELDACGLAPRKRGAQLPSLTPREHAIARLVAEGLTNREIATRLFVSVKTVEYHLANAFTKLGVRTRTQLAATLATSDLLSGT
jgi:ATP/maltotriose-dependent transcriptional regulator MalT